AASDVIATRRGRGSRRGGTRSGRRSGCRSGSLLGLLGGRALAVLAAGASPARTGVDVADGGGEQVGLRRELVVRLLDLHDAVGVEDRVLQRGPLCPGRAGGADRGHHDRQHREREQDEGDRADDLEERPRRQDRQRAGEVLLGERTEQETEHHGSCRDLHALEQHADHAEDEHRDDRRQAVRGGVRADDAEDEDAAPQIRLRYVEQLDHALHPHEAQRERQEGRDEHDPDDRDDEVGAVGEQRGPGGDAPDDHRADHHRHDGVPGDAECHRRGQRAAERRAGGGVGRGDALDRSLAEHLRVLRRLARPLPADEPGDVAAGRRDEADAEAHCPADRGGPSALLQLGAVRPPPAEARDRSDVRLPVREELIEQLGDAEEADDDGDEVHALDEFQHTEREALVGCGGVRSDAAEHESEEAREDALEHRLGRDADHDRDAEDDEREQFGRLEVVPGEAGDRHGGDREEHERGEDADGRHDRGDRQRETGPALFRHRIAVEGGGDGGGSPRGVDEDGRHPVAEVRRDVDRQQHRDALHGFEGHGEAGRERDGHGRGDTGEGADHEAEDEADRHVQQDRDVEERVQPLQERVHRGILRSMPKTT
ncbi:unnamed protein product, partial [Penicillium discolor]